MERFRENSTMLEEVNEEVERFIRQSSRTGEPSPPRYHEGGLATIDDAPLWNETATHEAGRSARIARSFSDFVDILNLREPARHED